MQKWYCYVDESGQDTSGSYFVVGIVLITGYRDEPQDWLTKLEESSGIRLRKWNKSAPWARGAYLMGILTTIPPTVKICFRYFSQTKDYTTCTVIAIEEAIGLFCVEPYKVTVIVDGASQVFQRKIGSRLRERRVKVDKVRGLKDESDPILRLADSIAGFVRDAKEGNKQVTALFVLSQELGVLHEVK